MHSLFVEVPADAIVLQAPSLAVVDTLFWTLLAVVSALLCFETAFIGNRTSPAVHVIGAYVWSMVFLTVGPLLQSYRAMDGRVALSDTVIEQLSQLFRTAGGPFGTVVPALVYFGMGTLLMTSIVLGCLGSVSIVGLGCLVFKGLPIWAHFLVATAWIYAGLILRSLGGPALVFL